MESSPYCCCRRLSFFRWFIIAMIVMSLAAGIVSFIIWLLFRHHFPYISLASASVSGLNVTNSSISGQWDISFDVCNPNKRMKVSYEDVRASVSYKWTELSRTDLAPFHQGSGNEMKVPATLAAVGAYVEPEVMKVLNAARARGFVNFAVEMDALVTVKGAAWWKWKSKNMHVVCDKITLAFLENSNKGTYAGGPQQCFKF